MKRALLFIIACTFSVACYGEDENVPATKITLDQATHEVIKEGNKRVLGVATEMIGGRAFYIIKVLTPDGHIRHYKVDAETGAISNDNH